MYEAANVYPILRPLGPAGTIEPDREDEDLRFGLTPLGAAVLGNCLARAGSAPRPSRRRRRAAGPPLPAKSD
jgi:hypothetical protein